MSSAVLAAALTQPIDVVKTRLMTQAASALPPYAGVRDCALTMLRTEGLAAFYAGLPRCLYAGPLWALQFGLSVRLSQALLERRRAAAEAAAAAERAAVERVGLLRGGSYARPLHGTARPGAAGGGRGGRRLAACSARLEPSRNRLGTF